MAATNASVILGTAAYMSPEQAKGRPVDRRTDIFAFGCVLYEMLTAHRAFEGEDLPDILSAVLKSEPDWTRLPAEVPRAVQKLLRLCLEKDTRKRRHDAGDVRIDIEQALAEPAATVGAVYDRPTARLAWIVAAASVVLAAVFAIPTVRHLRETSPPEMRVEINTPSTPAPLEFALAPMDGTSSLWHPVMARSGSGCGRWIKPTRSR